MTHVTRLTIEAPAKINLRLEVVGRRADGYHCLRMVMVPLRFGDTIELEVLPAGSVLAGDLVTDGIALRCDSNAVPLDADHLCVRAALALRGATGRRDAVVMRLTKRTPVGAGLGGGSSDAAAVLRGLNQLWGLGWSPAQLAELGVTLGADVPFFCYERPAYVTGIGEVVQPYAACPGWPLVLVNPRLHCPTPQVFRAYARRFPLTPPPPDASVPPPLRGLKDAVDLLRNDLEPVTVDLFPQVGEVLTAVRRAGARHVGMSGSGPTVFALCESVSERDAMAAVLQRETPWWVCATETIGT